MEYLPDLSALVVAPGNQLLLYSGSPLSFSFRHVFSRPEAADIAQTRADDGSGLGIADSSRGNITAFSSSGSQIAVATDCKQLFTFTVSRDDSGGVTATATGRQFVGFKSSCLIQREGVLLCGDRAGDVYSVSLPLSAGIQATVLLGRVSSLLAMTLRQDLLYTADRDETITVWHLPQTHVVHNYLLGHSEYVRCLASAGDWIVSAGGDGLIIVWEATTGRRLETVSTGAPVRCIAVAVDAFAAARRSLTRPALCIAAATTTSGRIGTYVLRTAEEGEDVFDSLVDIKTELEAEEDRCVALCVAGGEILSAVVEGEELVIGKVDLGDVEETYRVTLPGGSAERDFGDFVAEAAVLKKRGDYDNVGAYLEKKEKRLAEGARGEKLPKLDQ